MFPSKQASLAALAIAAFFVSIPVAITGIVDSATAEQCRTHDWSAERHAAHMQFCKKYAYLVR